MGGAEAKAPNALTEAKFPARFAPGSHERDPSQRREFTDAAFRAACHSLAG
jgi:hypothetical protein